MRYKLEVSAGDSERTRFDRLLKADSLALALYDMDRWLSSQIDYGSDEALSISTLEHVRAKMGEILSDNNLTYDEILD